MKTTLIYIFSLFFIASGTVAQAQTKEGSQINWNNKASIAGKQGGDLEKEELLNSKGVETSDSAHHISGFKLTIAIKDSDPAEFASEHTGKLTVVMHDAIKKAPVGSKLFFEYIYCSTIDNMPHILNPLTFVLK